MIFLVDTHVLLWAVHCPEKLTIRAREILLDPVSELLISAVTPWEMAIKSSIGKLENADDLLDNFDDRIAAGGYRTIDISPRHAIRAGRLPPYHKDPFDRLLIAQALDLQIPMISSDDIFDHYGVQRIWD